MTNGERNLPGFAWIMRCALFALACVLVLSPMAQAQYRTSIQGVVSDASGAVIPGAKLTLVNPATNEKIVRTTNEAGVYNFNALQADATFRMEVVAKGFEKKIIDHVQLVPDQSNGLNIKMAVGAETQVVTVDATAEPLLATTNANTVGVISEKQIQSMPAFGRDVFQLVQLTPGVFGDGSQQAGGGNNILDAGAGSDFLTGGSGDNQFYLDARSLVLNQWDTISDGHAGDGITCWGVTPQDFALTWLNGQGASGYTGLTGVFTAFGKPEVGVTLSGYTTADLSNGRLSVSYGSTPTTNGIAGADYFHVSVVA